MAQVLTQRAKVDGRYLNPGDTFADKSGKPYAKSSDLYKEAEEAGLIADVVTPEERDQASRVMEAVATLTARADEAEAKLSELRKEQERVEKSLGDKGLKDADKARIQERHEAIAAEVDAQEKLANDLQAQLAPFKVG